MADAQKVDELSIEEIKKILNDGDFEQFLEKKEGDHLEAKQQRPYDIDSQDATLAIASLASDVAALANGKGGYIVCGLITQKDQALQNDIVKSTDLMGRSDFYDQDRIQGIIKDSIYPKLEIKISWHASSLDSKVGVGAIYVPPQDEEKKYFMVRVGEIEGKVIKKNYVGIPVRKGSEPVWISVDEIYRLSKRTPTSLQQFHDSLSQQISELKDVMESTTEVRTPADDLSRKIEEVLDVH
jgi:predicted HTH transcriptional regulator